MSEILEQLTQAIEQRRYDALENLWLELLDAETIPAEALARLLGHLLQAGQTARALDLTLALAPELVRNERHAEALPLLRAAAPAAAGNEEFRSALLACYRRVHRGVPHLAACIERSGLLTEQDLGASVATLDKLLSYREGDFFYHATGWGLGKIVAFDPLTARATINFERKPGHLVPLETIESIFQRLKPDCFLVLLKTDPDRLRRLAQEDPAALVRSALEALDGRLSLRGLREFLEGPIVPAEAWSKWWNGAKAAIKRDPRIALPAGSNPILTLRPEALTYEEEMQRRFAALKDLTHQTEALADYAEHRDREADPQAFLLPAARTIASRIASEPDPGAAVEAALLLTRLKLLAGEFPTPEELVARHKGNPVVLLNHLTTNASRARIFQMLRDQADDWRQVCRGILLEGPDALWEAAAAELPPDGDAPNIGTVVREVLANPKRHLSLFAWVCRNLLLERWPSPATRVDIFERLLKEGDELARRKAYQRGEWTPFSQADEMAEIRLTLRAGDLRYFDQMLAEISEVEASRLLFRIRQSSVLPEQFARLLEQKMVRKFPKLLVEEEHKTVEEPVQHIYATAQAIARRREEHDHIVNVLLPKNSEDIAKAKAMGDLSDNADFRAAIQEQHVLNAKALEMGEELLRARPIEPSMVAREHVSIGARVTVEDVATGKRQTFAILGPWDSDAEHGIIAYVAPLAQALMRHKVGDQVAFSHAGEDVTYRIVEIGSALEPAQGSGNA
ncbi:MAG TPA: GreA/GreB family elongation factor [Planctomycetota bacterium]|nr:GreA/GreB family elongation factor [Planctomycetota bacterium]HRR82717.1 GreA/GreB family elongation factor [Planctomycetota bacterium]HRT95946.1 GreA/GreB family elongation factor [Planctomycetota bacterium]